MGGDDPNKGAKLQNKARGASHRSPSRRSPSRRSPGGPSSHRRTAPARRRRLHSTALMHRSPRQSARSRSARPSGTRSTSRSPSRPSTSTARQTPTSPRGCASTFTSSSPSRSSSRSTGRSCLPSSRRCLAPNLKCRRERRARVCPPHGRAAGWARLWPHLGQTASSRCPLGILSTGRRDREICGGGSGLVMGSQRGGARVQESAFFDDGRPLGIGRARAAHTHPARRLRVRRTRLLSRAGAGGAGCGMCGAPKLQGSTQHCQTYTSGQAPWRRFAVDALCDSVEGVSLKGAWLRCARRAVLRTNERPGE